MSKIVIFLKCGNMGFRSLYLFENIFTVLKRQEGVYLMKKLLTKGVLLLFIVSLLFSFAACGKDKEDATTGIPTTTEQATTMQTTVNPMTTPLTVEIIKIALNSTGDTSWDGNYESLTEAQKQAITEYFADKGKTVDFRADNAYLGDISNESTTSSDETAGIEGSTKKPGADAPKATGVAVKSLALNESAIDLSVGASKQLTATVSPSTAKDKNVSWRSDNDKVASVNSSGMVVAKANGTAKIVCTANSNKAITAVCTVKVDTLPTGAVLSYLYNEDEGFFYIENDPWQRQFGFNKLYDKGAPITQMFYNTVRVQYNYGGKDWMVQMWKGQYGYAFIGSEIGVYNKERTVEHYDCAANEDMLKMQMTLYKYDKWQFTREYAPYWWITGFVPGSLTKYADRTELTMLAIITLKDATMKDAFVTSLAAQGFTEGYSGFGTPDTYKVEGNSVHLNWKNIGQRAIKPTTTAPTTSEETTTES